MEEGEANDPSCRPSLRLTMSTGGDRPSCLPARLGGSESIQVRGVGSSISEAETGGRPQGSGLAAARSRGILPEINEALGWAGISAGTIYVDRIDSRGESGSWRARGLFFQSQNMHASRVIPRHDRGRITRNATTGYPAISNETCSQPPRLVVPHS